MIILKWWHSHLRTLRVLLDMRWLAQVPGGWSLLRPLCRVLPRRRSWGWQSWHSTGGLSAWGRPEKWCMFLFVCLWGYLDAMIAHVYLSVYLCTYFDFTSKTWPRWLPHSLQLTSVLIRLGSAMIRNKLPPTENNEKNISVNITQFFKS